MTTSTALLSAAQVYLSEADAIAGAIHADALSGEPALDVAGLISAQRRALLRLGAQLDDLERVGRKLTRFAPRRRKQTPED